MSTMQTPRTTSGFLDRQLAPKATRYQCVFDVLFGILAPIACLVFDPGIFHGGLLGAVGMLESIKWFAYLAIIVQVITLAFWLQRGAAFEDWIGCIAGIFLAGTLCAALIGIRLLPLTLLGLILVIGVLGFIPFLTTGVFARNAFRALRLAAERLPPSRLHGTLVLGVLIAILLPAAPQLYAHYRRPDIENLIVYPLAENVQIGDYEATDSSGPVEEKRISFDTSASETEIRQFYDQILTRSGWTRTSEHMVWEYWDYTYHAVSGRSYSVGVQYEAHTNARNSVTIHLRRDR